MSVKGEGSADAATPLTRPTVVRAVAEALKDQLPRLAAKETSDGNTSTDTTGASDTGGTGEFALHDYQCSTSPIISAHNPGNYIAHK